MPPKTYVITITQDAHRHIKKTCADTGQRIPAAVDALIQQSDWARQAAEYLSTIPAPVPPVVASLLLVSPFAPTE